MPSARRPLVVALVRKARRATPGRCFVCGCTDDLACLPSGPSDSGCSWVKGTQNRLCSAHPHDDLVDAKRALRQADKEVRRG